MIALVADLDAGRGVRFVLVTPGTVLAGKYRIERLLGRGGMGAVYAAQHELLAQRVAVKLLLPETTRDPRAIARFLDEARAAARIEGEHVARVMDVGTLDDGAPYMVLEYLEGRDLAATLEAGGPLRVEEAVDYILQALEAIAQAHALGIVHRDLKPANLFVSRGADGHTRVKVLDFGISKVTNTVLAPTSGHTSTGSMFGSPCYMAPEQLRNAKLVDTAADIWGIGVILYEMLTGEVPFSGSTLGEILVAIVERAPAPISSQRAGVPAGLEAVVACCLERRPEDRFANVHELASALAPFASFAQRVSVERIARRRASSPGGDAPAVWKRSPGSAHDPAKCDGPALLR